ncbi:MAG: hypothetical protein H8E41_10745 [Desulfobulbaceae bacterium]|uniref:Zinc finger/thioredoxin putative domain-containing protein n=1 Tax=Candidatus Desulfobia pelagia TaxID=2841692 RepID=A0A8J6NEV3_9BACT|nr:hypothetical protein [Candidatus Desulfobia pelagia]
MINHCPHCKKKLSFTEAQLEKIEEALFRLQPGQVIKMGCPHCKVPIELKKEVQPERKDASTFFPGLLDGDIPAESPPAAAAPPAEEVPDRRPQVAGAAPPPPKPPDISWLKTGEYGEKAHNPDDATILILMPDGEGKNQVAEAFKRMDYRIDYAASLGETMEKMVSASYAGVVLHTGFEGGSLAESRVHHHMKWLPMPKRRYIYYVLVGPDLQTLYDLEAFTLSANLVINEKDLGNINVILRKGFHDHETLFHPFLESLKKG